MRLAVTGACLLLGGQAVLGMGDRFAWSPAQDGLEETEGTEEVVRTVRKVEEAEDQVEGRFVGKEVLCTLGLADCSPKLSDVGIQYVQPVKVIPYGKPVPAVQAGGQYSVPVERAGSDYGAPAPSYGAPKPSYGAPKPSYGAPKPSYGAPAPSYGAPKPSYGAPNPKPSYGAPASAPAPVYAPPPAKYGAPSTGYGAPAAPVLGHVRDQRETDFQTAFEPTASTAGEVERPTREGRLEECYCVPAAQCPAGSKVGGVFKDYSALINPRVKDSNIGITAPLGRSGEAVVEVVSVSASSPRVEEEDEEVTRRRRNGQSTDREQPNDRLANVFVPDEAEDEVDEEYDEDYDGDLFLSRDGADIDLETLNAEDRKKRRAARRAERQANRRAAAAKAELEAGTTDGLPENADLVDAVGQDKSFDSLSSFTDDVSTKVGSVGSEVSSGVTRVLGDLSNLLTGSTSSGQLQPTIGFSFGLPQAGPGYGGYQQNPVGTGSAVNPYYTGAQGIEFGAVNLNPLFSFQAGTTDTGDLALKPLVNLHLTPNGCGVLGCDKATYDDVDFALKSIPNPIDAVKSLFAKTPDYGLYGDYTAPKPSYLAPNTGYGPPTSGYGPPSPGYGPPTSGYGPPTSGYGPPTSGYGPPTSGYGPPSSNYGSPSPNYEAPSDGYEAPVPSYRPPSYTSEAHSSHQEAGPVNIHHHFHHQAGAKDAVVQENNQHFQYQAGARDSVLQENNHVKRNTEIGGFIPMDGLTSPQSSGGGFRFPRTSSRGGRRLELPEEEVQLSGFRFAKEKGGRRLDLEVEVEEDLEAEEGGRRLDVEMKEEDLIDEGGRRLDRAVGIWEEDLVETPGAEVAEEADKVEVVYGEEVAPQGGKVKFVERRRRSADGAGHHGQHHGQHQSALVGQAQPFGPTGVRPPQCGGPTSGYVCCRHPGSSGSSASLALDFNELAPSSSIRDVRQQPQHFNGVVSSGLSQFSTFGQCGRRNAQGVTGRINNPANSFNEGDTEFGEYPWQAAILKKEEYDNVYVCGGSLIDASHVITAAHCIKQYRPEQLRIRLGEWDVNNDSEFYPNIELDVLSISIHPEFYSGNLYNDIAVIKLDGFLDFQRNPHISPVCLPDSLADFAGERCYVSGWGKDAFGGDGSYQHTLKEVDVPVVGHAECERKLKQTRLGYEFTLHPGFVCAGGEEGKDACKGDGGGPLVCQVRGSWQLAGLVSWGVGCGQRDVPGVYVKVSHYNQWIQEMMLTT